MEREGSEGRETSEDGRGKGGKTVGRKRNKCRKLR